MTQNGSEAAEKPQGISAIDGIRLLATHALRAPITDIERAQIHQVRDGLIKLATPPPAPQKPVAKNRQKR